jgi:hypothetical protein
MPTADRWESADSSRWCTTESSTASWTRALRGWDILAHANGQVQQIQNKRQSAPYRTFGRVLVFSEALY